MPHKRRCRLNNHSELKDLAETDPDSEDIFMEDVIGTHYRDQTILMISVCTILLPITTGTQKIVGVNECTENLQSETAEEAFNHLLPANDNCSAYHARLQTMLKVQAKLKAISDARKSDAADEEASKELDDHPQLLGEAKSAMQDVHDMNDNKTNDLTFDDRVEMLNLDQRRIFENVKAHLLHQVKH